MTILLVIIHILVSIFLIGVVLLQRGKGADMGAAFGSSSSQTLFGSRGPGSFLSKLTTIAAVIFIITSFTLAFVGSSKRGSSVIPEQPEVPVSSQPAGPLSQPSPSAPVPPSGTATSPVPETRQATPSVPATPPAPVKK